MLVKILLTATALFASAFLTLIIRKVSYENNVGKIWHSLLTQPKQSTFTESMVAELPAPVKRYFLHAIATGTPLATSVTLEMNGNFRPSEDKPWLPMQAKQIISAMKGFVWQARVGKGVMQISGADYYWQKSGRMGFSLWGLLPLVNASSADIARSAIGRLAVELIWLPSALLPQNGVNWQEIDDNTIQASFEIDGEPVKLTLVIDADGKLLKVSLPRWGDKTETGEHEYIPFGGEVQAENTFDGFTIPSQIIVGWWFGTEKYSEFLCATIHKYELHNIHLRQTNMGQPKPLSLDL
ncbi:MAG: hypothetical protein QNJ47_27615 [Nostocaceae cyanobacterium]|nr:hypothetical protein [Nostocaceae cyanobacterium]